MTPTLRREAGRRLPLVGWGISIGQVLFRLLLFFTNRKTAMHLAKGLEEKNKAGPKWTILPGHWNLQPNIWELHFNPNRIIPSAFPHTTIGLCWRTHKQLLMVEKQGPSVQKPRLWGRKPMFSPHFAHVAIMSGIKYRINNAIWFNTLAHFSVKTSWAILAN